MSNPGRGGGGGLKARFDFPKALVFERSPTSKPDSTLWIACGDRLSLRRYQMNNRQVTTLKLDSLIVHPTGMDCLSTGHLLVGCRITNTIYLVDPSTGHCTRIAGSPLSERWEGSAQWDFGVCRVSLCVTMSGAHISWNTTIIECDDSLPPLQPIPASKDSSDACSIM